MTVERVARPCREHIELELSAATFPASAPGQFLELLCRDDAPLAPRVIEWNDDAPPALHDLRAHDDAAYLRRPFSIADRWSASDGSPRLAVISRAIGVGTRWLDGLSSGATLNVSGPLGRGFRAIAPDREVLLVGGGVGIPPLLYFARALWESGRRGATAIFGATSADLLPVRLTAPPQRDGRATPCLALPGSAAFPAIVTTDDGSLGLLGRVTDGILAWRRAASGRAVTIAACGPSGMLRAVAALARELGAECQLCIERNMGCGMGTCLSCVVRRRDADAAEGWRWALACTDGPVFDATELLDFAPA